MCDTHRSDDLLKNYVDAVLSRLVFELNSFKFDGIFFIKTSGTAIGSKRAPNYANNLRNNFCYGVRSNQPSVESILTQYFLSCRNKNKSYMNSFELLNKRTPSIVLHSVIQALRFSS